MKKYRYVTDCGYLIPLSLLTVSWFLYGHQFKWIDVSIKLQIFFDKEGNLEKFGNE